MLSNERDSAEKSLPLLLLPGTLCDARVFKPLQERLGDLKTKVVVTLGAGSLKEAAEHVLAEAPERFALLGFSLGGMVAMETALSAPKRVRGLALINTTPLPVVPELHGPRRTAVEQARVMGMARFLRERLWPQYRGRVECPEVLPLLEDMAESLGDVVFARQTELALGRSDFRPRLGAVACPVLLLAGAEDKVCPPAIQQELAAALPHSTRSMLPGVGHFALLESPDEVASSVAAWFHTVESTESGIHDQVPGVSAPKENQ